MKYIIKNHKLIKEKQAQIAIDERGFLFGDGIFETCNIFNGKIYNFKAHQTRLLKGLEFLKISCDITDLQADAARLITKNKIKNGILRISISRGIGSVGYLPIATQALIIIQTLKSRKIPPKISLTISDIKKPPQNSFPINCKTNNALPYILNKIYAQENHCFDAIMLTQRNYICETSSANIFWVKNKKIYTPSLDCDILPGTIRARLLEISPIKIFEKKATLEELKNADEIFLTNATMLTAVVDELVIKNIKIQLQKEIGQKIFQTLIKDVKKSCL